MAKENFLPNRYRKQRRYEKTISVAVTKETFDALVFFAKRDGCSVTQAARQIIESGIEAQREVKPWCLNPTSG